MSAMVAPDHPFATVFIPRFGADYARTVSEGVDTAVALRAGIGHYPGNQMPGQLGNFAVAAHRTTFGAPFNLIATLRVGDKIFCPTRGRVVHLHCPIDGHRFPRRCWGHPSGSGASRGDRHETPDYDDQLSSGVLRRGTHCCVQRFR